MKKYNILYRDVNIDMEEMVYDNLFGLSYNDEIFDVDLSILIFMNSFVFNVNI